MRLTPRQQVRAALETAVRSLGVAEDEMPDLELMRAKNRLHGDYASGAGLKLARTLRRPPPQIAAELAERIDIPEATAEAAGGYVNFRLRDAWLRDLVTRVAGEGPRYGSSDLGRGEKVQVEFASVNPTGPLHIGHGRGVILGDAVARVLAFTGHNVQREYYVNDQNTQARLFSESVYARLHGQEPPENGYRGGYVTEIARAARAALPGIEELGFEEAEPKVRRFAIDRMVEQLAASVARMGVTYDEWYRESALWQQGLPQEAIERLRAGGYLVEKEGAVWFSYGEGDEDDEDRVVIRSTGEPTYFASDLGYLLSKFEGRGFQRVIDVWGSDHHGYVPRMKAACDALGIGRDRLVVILNQIVNMKEGRMSKRLGRFVPLDTLVDEVGADAVRYFYLLRSPEAMLEFDLDLMLAQSNENPVYYAQYAHARMANLEEFAREHAGELPEAPDLTRLQQPWELDLAREVAFWPESVEDAARLLEPHRIPYAIHELADRVHGFYQAGNRDWKHRVVVDGEPELTRARLELCRAARHTLKSALTLVGVSAPDKM
ncbi:MAG TPA: arginine--tRNA ligase [Candidatus Dormibacteraeota bacterium]